MFSSQAVKALLDLSLDLSDPTDWQAGLLRTVRYHLDITAVATEPVSGLFAVGMCTSAFGYPGGNIKIAHLCEGTAHGCIHLYGSPGVECMLQVSDPAGLRIKFLQFASSVFKLLCIGTNATSVLSMSDMELTHAQMSTIGSLYGTSQTLAGQNCRR